MNSKLLLVGIVLIILIGGGLFFSQQQEEPSSLTTTDVPIEQSNDFSQSSVRYVPYSEGAFENAMGKRRVFYFHADWCPVCRPLDATLSKNPNQIPEGVVLFKTNYDTETALKQKYGVTYQHTFVEVDDQGNLIQIWSGGSVDDVITRLQG